MNIFISCPISKYYNSNNKVNRDYINFLEKIYQICNEKSESVYLAIKNDDYNIRDMDSDEVCTLNDYNALLMSDLVIAIPEDSQGVAIELGWASALKKKIIVVYESQYAYSSLIKALDVVSETIKLFLEKGDGYSSVDNKFYEKLERLIG